MKVSSSTVALTAAGLLAATGNAEPIKRTSKCGLPLVQDVRASTYIVMSRNANFRAQKALVDAILLEDLVGCAQDLEDIAYATSRRNRVCPAITYITHIQSEGETAFC